MRNSLLEMRGVMAKILGAEGVGQSKPNPYALGLSSNASGCLALELQPAQVSSLTFVSSMLSFIMVCFYQCFLLTIWKHISLHGASTLNPFSVHGSDAARSGGDVGSTHDLLFAMLHLILQSVRRKPDSIDLQDPSMFACSRKIAFHRIRQSVSVSQY